MLLQGYGSVAPPWSFMKWTYIADNDAIVLIQTTEASPLPSVGGGSLVVRTFQATQTGSFNLHFSIGSETGSKTLDYIINVTQP